MNRMKIPAIAGGIPARKTLLPLHRPQFSSAEESAIKEVLASGWLSAGPQAELFEKDFARYVQAKYALALNSGTSALHLALKTIGIKPQDEIITTCLTFAATANVIVHCGAVPVFVDVDRNTLNIDPKEIVKAISPRTKAIIPVHLYGQPCLMKEIKKIARKNKLYVIEDASHALEAVSAGRKIGTISDITCFSLHPAKNITSGEGGMLVTNSKKLIQKARVLAFHGLDTMTWKSHSQKTYRGRRVVEAGFKYLMPDIQAAIGRCQLKKTDQFWGKRARIAAYYTKSFKSMSQIRVVTGSPGDGLSKNSLHLYVIEILPESLRVTRDQIIKALFAENVSAGVHYHPLHLQPYYRKTFGFKPQKLPRAEGAASGIISLPMFPSMADKDMRDVAAALKKIIAYYRR